MEQKITIIAPKKKKKILENLSKFFETRKIDKDDRLNFVTLIIKYALNFYSLDYVSLDFSNEFSIGEACSVDNTITLSNKIFSEKSNKTLFKEIIIAIFHEMNHVFIDNIEDDSVKGLNGYKTVFLSGESYNVVEYAKEKGFSQDILDMLTSVLYFNSQKERYAHISSIKVAFKFLNELKNYVTNFEFINILEKELKNELDYYYNNIKDAKNYTKNLANDVIIKKIIKDFQKQVIVEILNKNESDENYATFLNLINDGFWDSQMDKYYKVMLLNSNLKNFDKATFFADLINLMNYKIDENDIQTSFDLFFKANLKNYCDIKIFLNKIDDEILQKQFLKYKEKHNERLS